MRTSSVSRRRFITMGGTAAFFGLAACARAGLAADPVYQGPLIDAHSHVPPPNFPGPKFTADELAAAANRAGIDKVVVFGVPPGFDPAKPVIPVMYTIPTGGRPFDYDSTLGHLKAGRFRGVKTVIRHVPFPMAPRGVEGNATDPFFKRLFELSAATGRPLTVHIEGPGIDDLDAVMREFPDAVVVMAHLGQRLGQERGRGSVTPETIVQMIVAHRGFHLDLSVMSPTNFVALPHAIWDPILIAHPSRFLFGLDIFLPARPLGIIPSEVRYWRSWLAKLPNEVAEQIAYRNAQRLWLS